MRFLRRRVVEPDLRELEVSHAGVTFPVAIRRRTSARRITLRVSSATGDVVLTLPDRTAISSARPFLDAHAGWIATRVKRLPERAPLVPDAVVPLRGVPHRIVQGSTARGPTRALADAAGEPVIAVCGDEAGLPGRVRRYLIAEAERDVRAAVARHAARLGATPSRVTLRDTTSRWGSCSSTGSLSFSWRLILAPPLVLDYLAAHEVAHLRELNHSQRFWTLTRDLCPRTDEAEAWLKRHGAGLHRFG